MPLGALGRIPGLAGYLGGQEQDRIAAAAAQQGQLGQLQQVGALQGILAKVQAAKKQQEYEKAMSGAKTDEERMAIAQGGASPDAVLRTGTASLDRQNALKMKAAELVQAHQFRLAEIKQRSTDAAATAKELLAEKQAFEGRMKQFMVDNRPPVQPQPVTAVTIQDPKDPNATIVIDGRTKQVLGKGPKMTEAGRVDAKTNLMMTGLGSDLQTAEDLLTGVTRTSDGQVVKGNLPTGSGVGSLYDKAAGFFGMSPEGAAEADSLKTVAARLVSRIPRFEGPQSDKDVKLYQQAAGDAGNDNLPRGRRIAALKTMRSIYAGYESGQRGRLIGNRRAADGAAAPKVVDFNSLPE